MRKKIKGQKLKKLEEDLKRLQKVHAKSLKDDNKSEIIKLKKEIDDKYSGNSKKAPFFKTTIL